MEFTNLTPNAENTLREILNKRDVNGDCDIDYWEKCFSELSFAECVQLKSIFKELSDDEMIEVRWAENIPYFLVLLNKGLSYFEIKKRKEQEEVCKKRSERQHDIMMLIIGTILGGFIEFLLFKFFGIGG